MPAAARLAAGFLDDPHRAGHLPAWVLDYARTEARLDSGDRVLVAVSGGPDSAALLHLLHRWREALGVALAVGHVDHGLRGLASRDDAAFVARLAGNLGLLCHETRVNVLELSRQARVSPQMAARRLRLEFLGQVCRDHGYNKLALGHTADDQVELFWLRLLRGAGPEGLKGMWPCSADGKVRPLLAVAKAVILAWLAQEGLDYRTDLSNARPTCPRNRLRLEFLPELQQSGNPRLAQAIWRAQALLQADERYLAAETRRVWPRVCRELALECFALNIAALLDLAPPLQGRGLRHTIARLAPHLALSAGQVAAILALAKSGRSGGLLALDPDAAVARAGPELHIFQPLPPPLETAAALPLPDGEAVAGGWQWRLKIVDADQLSNLGYEKFKVQSSRFKVEVALMDLERLGLPLALGYLQPGERFWPLGAPGEKKLQDFLVDAKVPRWLRPHIPVVRSQGRAVWLPGLRLADPVKITPHTRRVLIIHASPITPAAQQVWQVLSNRRR